MTIRASHRQNLKDNTSQLNNRQYKERIVIANCWRVIHASMRRGDEPREMIETTAIPKPINASGRRANNCVIVWL